MTRITTNVLRDISLFHADSAEGAEISFAMDKCTANLCVTLRPLREKNLFLCTSVKILCKSVHSVCPQKICVHLCALKSSALFASKLNLCIPCILCAKKICPSILLSKKSVCKQLKKIHSNYLTFQIIM